MSSQPPPQPAPVPPPRPAPKRRVRAASDPQPGADKAKVKASPWGWLEIFVVSQTALPALLFVPGSSPIRTPLRASAYVIALIAWYFVAKKAKPKPGTKSFPARPWLIGCAIWIGVSILHPNSYSLVAAIAQAAMYFSVMSPAFWAPSALNAPSQIGRLMMILLVCNALSSIMGILQVFRPETFNPPVIPAMNNVFGGADLMYEGSDGRKIMRPCGLTDTPGGVAPAGLASALTGLCWALLPLPLWKRGMAIFMAFIGIAVIYFTQVRFSFVMLAICFATLTGLLIMQRDMKKAALLSTLAITLVVCAFTVVAMSAGTAMIDRFMTLFTNDPGKLYGDSRGNFIQETFDILIWDYPLGYGMGWWGMINSIFGSPSKPSTVWCEVMVPAWVFDGGIPLLVAYSIAIVITMLDSLRIARTCKAVSYTHLDVYKRQAFNRLVRGDGAGLGVRRRNTAPRRLLHRHRHHDARLPSNREDL